MAQSVQAMVKNQPFPYRTGVAMDTTLYGRIKAKLEAAERLKLSADAAIAGLQMQISSVEKAYADLHKLGQYDAAKAQTLLAQIYVLQGQLTQAQTTLRGAGLARDEIVRMLPRSVRKTLTDATPDQIAQATVDYVRLLQKRKWKWLGVGAGLGVIVGFVAPIVR